MGVRMHVCVVHVSVFNRRRNRCRCRCCGQHLCTLGCVALLKQGLMILVQGSCADAVLLLLCVVRVPWLQAVT
jgi:hypothetical protein